MKTSLKTCFAAGIFSFASACAHATVIDWNTWVTATSGTISAPGPVTVTFSAGGSTDNLVSGYPSYTPNATFADGVIVNNAPNSGNGIIQLVGGNSNVNTITFSTAVVDPVMAIWSLGQGGLAASFNFINATPTFVAGGPSAEYNGSAISVSGNNVYGQEGNGTVEFAGTFTSISWTNPVAENWYGFNVGVEGTAPAVPEPATTALIGLGLLGFAVARRKSGNNNA